MSRVKVEEWSKNVEDLIQKSILVVLNSRINSVFPQETSNIKVNTRVN
jgi:hypothetical protein